MVENTLEEEILENSDNTEGFSPEDYLETPSLGTIEAEYAEAPAKTNSYHNNTPILNQGNVGACSVFGITKADGSTTLKLYYNRNKEIVRTYNYDADRNWELVDEKKVKYGTKLEAPELTYAGYTLTDYNTLIIPKKSAFYPQ